MRSGRPRQMALIVAQALRGISGARIVEKVLRVRPQAWPNPLIRKFVDA
jgi:hypothetical protein